MDYQNGVIDKMGEKLKTLKDLVKNIKSSPDASGDSGYFTHFILVVVITSVIVLCMLLICKGEGDDDNSAKKRRKEKDERDLPPLEKPRFTEAELEEFDDENCHSYTKLRHVS